jgi:nuclear transport factor 2 (NTF2) superfamily protein
MTNEELAALILPWAHEHMSDAYEQTLRVANRPAVFRNYLVRLIERRWEREPEWRLQVPLRALEETGVTATLWARAIGERIIVKGKRAEGERHWSFGELCSMLENGVDFNNVHATKLALDLVIDDD